MPSAFSHAGRRLGASMPDVPDVAPVPPDPKAVAAAAAAAEAAREAQRKKKRETDVQLTPGMEFLGLCAGGATVFMVVHGYALGKESEAAPTPCRPLEQYLRDQHSAVSVFFFWGWVCFLTGSIAFDSMRRHSQLPVDGPTAPGRCERNAARVAAQLYPVLCGFLFWAVAFALYRCVYPASEFAGSVESAFGGPSGWQALQTIDVDVCWGTTYHILTAIDLIANAMMVICVAFYGIAVVLASVIA